MTQRRPNIKVAIIVYRNTMSVFTEKSTLYEVFKEHNQHNLSFQFRYSAQSEIEKSVYSIKNFRREEESQNVPSPLKPLCECNPLASMIKFMTSLFLPMYIPV